jgi:hypothetical protein
VGSLERRLEELEEQFRSGEQAGGGTSPREWEQLFHAQENSRREFHGLEPLPDLPYTEEDRENDLDTLAYVIPVYRASLGWQSEEGQTKLDAWEEQLKQRIERK